MKKCIVALAVLAAMTGSAYSQAVCFGTNCGEQSELDTMYDFYSLIGRMRTNQTLLAYGVISVDEPTSTPRDACYDKCDKELADGLDYCRSRYTTGSPGSMENIMANNCMQAQSQKHYQCLAPMMMKCG